MKIYKIKCCNEIYEIKLVARTYANNGRLAVQTFTVLDGEPFATITVNINYPISGDKAVTAFVDTNNYGFLKIEKFLQDNQIAKPTGRFGESGYCAYPEYIFDLTKF
ncbi:MAG: DUF4313 domain-containing protein [Clostridia bacterium]|nr:DUF4313 domain-containing protein [Clostridia bacterium]